MLVLDTASGQVTAQIPVGASPHQAPLTPDGRAALVPSQGPGELAIVETAIGGVAGVVAVGKTPHWVASSSDGAMAFVANEGSNDVSVVDLAARKVVATIPVGSAPRKIAVQPGVIRKASREEGASVARVANANRETRDVRSARDVSLRADDYSFAPAVLRARSGQPLRLHVENGAGTLHNLSVPALGVDKDVPARGRIDVDVVVPAAGPVEFFCKFHGPLGQNGEIVVD